MPVATSISLKNLKLPSQVESIILAAPMPGLGLEPRCAMTAKSISGIDGDSIPGLCMAGLWLLAGDLDRSHDMSQSDNSASGSYWHGIMHRREGDFWNANYWFRKVGRHAVLNALGNEVAASDTFDKKLVAKLVPRHEFDPSALTDEVKRATGLGAELDLLTEAAWLEWQHLFSFCWMERSTC
jgi:hypothetical protein